MGYALWAETPVFVLHSYHESYPWTQKQHAGFVSVLHKSQKMYPLCSTEYLDTKRRDFDQAYEEEFVHYIASKYKGYRPNIIYVTDDNALHFMVDNKAKIFPGVPIVFSGVNDLSKKETLDKNTFTGIFEKKEIIPNLQLIQQLFPNEHEVLLIGDGSSTARAIHQDIRRDAAAVQGINLQYVNAEQFDQVLSKVKKFKGKTVVLTTIGGFLTRDGHLIPLTEVITKIKETAPFVIFSLEDTYIQEGVLGGYAVDGISQGIEAGKIALQILSYPDSTLPGMNDNTNRWIFDADVLMRQKIILSDDIREQSRFLNLPETFFQKHQEWVINLLYGLSAVVVLGSLLFALMMYRSRKTIAQRQSVLSQLSESLNRAQQIAHIGNWEWDIQTNALWWSDEIYRIFGLEPQQFKATYEGFLERVYPDDRQKIQKAVMDTLNHNTHYSVVHRILRQDGKIRHVLEEGSLISDDLGNPLKMTGIVHDITEEYEKEKALQRSEIKYKNLVENAMVGVYRSDLSGNIFYVNQALAHMLAFYSSDELIGKNSIIRYADPEDREIFIHKLLEEGHISNYELEILDKYSNVVPVMVSATIEGDILSGMIIDMRDMKKSHEQIEKLSKVVEQIDDSVVITDKFGKITYVNPAFCDHTGYTKEEVLGKTPRMLKSDQHDPVFYERLWKTILNGDIFRETIINRKKNGDLFYEDKTITPLKDDKNNFVGFVSSGKDVTQESLLNQEIYRIATIDKLTGIYNRHKFEALFLLESERSRRFSLPLSMILIDIDHFKVVNDSYGHDVGDKVLKLMAKVIEENIRKIDIFARWGGEEFLVLSPGTDLKNIQILAQKLCLAVENTIFPEVGRVTISCGISSFHSNDTFSEFFKCADQGLYRAKESGRNQVGVLP
ncbi:MAG TPA: ABC transporter substrate binding protein [Sulfuricurvum sp.]|nr:ABC transporter substrate binding protein [Sulfuricurvum sp.]